jgi:fluoride ion exporter CrcB/FEX
MFAHGHAATAVAYLAATVIGGLAAAWLGRMLMRAAGVRRDRRVR